MTKTTKYKAPQIRVGHGNEDWKQLAFYWAKYGIQTIGDCGLRNDLICFHFFFKLEITSFVTKNFSDILNLVDQMKFYLHDFWTNTV